MILHTEVVGEGEPLVFLHTGLQTGRTDFDKQREYFSSKYQVISPDLRGHGKSPAEDLDDYYNQAADDLADTQVHGIIESSCGRVFIWSLSSAIFSKKTSWTCADIDNLRSDPSQTGKLGNFE
ncbi:alpha/beta fold hydrolase [Halobacillus trueperi]|uniref:alpha/beta fold hydrolase n=1 Tax=Halobacillus trueperi TaxID=156205 RepID=UPI0037358471